MSDISVFRKNKKIKILFHFLDSLLLTFERLF
jgi:hypothetical protein